MSDDIKHNVNHNIIGKGTWYDKAASELIEREKRLGRSLNLIRTESGLGASGFPHIGSLGDALRNFAVALGCRVQGYPAELIAFSDDKDGLRKVPAGLPKELEKWLGYSVSTIPDPAGDCHNSFGAHMTSQLLAALDMSGADYHFMSGFECYKQGIFDREILEIMNNHERVGRIIEEEIGQEKYTEELPYFVVCEKCGRIYTTHATRYHSESQTIEYECNGMEVRGNWLEGCGHKGEVNILSGKGKLSWKVEFAARWRALDIRFEAYGKDIADSVRVNDRICREILGWEPPMHVQYEMFTDRSGKKISKSAGNVFTPQVWYRYGSPQSLNLLIFKRFVGTKSGSVEDIPTHMDELDDTEDIYFGKSKALNDMEKAQASGLYEYCWMLKPPKEPEVHVPYNLVLKLARLAPKGSEAEFITSKLREYGYFDKTENGLLKRIGYALNWVEDFAEELPEINLTEQEAVIVKTVIAELRNANTPEELQGVAFNAAKKYDLKPRDVFPIVYKVLLGKSQGPRLGPYIILVGKENIISELENTLKKRE
ncbi:MAG: lysine--tRNA ligase [Candidatus Bathyarchaeia archaeon]